MRLCFADDGTVAVSGIRGRLRRDERDIVRSIDPYVQLEWDRGRWVTTLGLRHNRVDFDVDVDDHYLSNGDDGGSAGYRHATPLLGVLFKLSPGRVCLERCGRTPRLGA